MKENLRSLVQSHLWAQVLLALFLGALIGVLMGPSFGLVAPPLAKSISDWAALPGQIFLSLIQMIVIPLIFASIVVGISSSESMGQLKTVGFLATAFFLVTTTLSILVGIGLALLIKPGLYIKTELLGHQSPSSVNGALDAGPAFNLNALPEKIVSLIPTNPLQSVLNMEMLQVVILALIFGVAVVAMNREQVRPIFEFLKSLQEVCLTIVKGAMKLAPIAVFGLTLQLAAQVGLNTLLGMAVYVGTVLLGLGLLLGFYLVLIFFQKGVSLRDFLTHARELQLLAFSTSSSAAVMPLAMTVSEEKFNVAPSIAKFVIPLGATINMNGTALYQGVATLFLAQAFGVDLDTGGLALLVVTAVSASIGSPATPGVGIVILSMILTSVGVPLEGVGLLLGVDRILDMSRTAVNVTGDLVATILIDRRIRKAELRKDSIGEAP